MIRKLFALAALLACFSVCHAQSVLDSTARAHALPMTGLSLKPSFPGGDDALQKFLAKHLDYPEAARENGIEGTVVLEFVINTDGSITDIKPIQSVGGGCTEEAIHVVQQMPKFIPGKNNDELVPVIFYLPVMFKLSSR